MKHKTKASPFIEVSGTDNRHVLRRHIGGQADVYLNRDGEGAPWYLKWARFPLTAAEVRVVHRTLKALNRQEG